MSTKKLLAAAATLILGATGAVPVHAQAGFSATMVGHEYRQDDLPSVASAPDGSVWVAWLSFAGDRDDEPSDETGQLVENDTRLLYEDTRAGNGLSIPHTSR